MRTEQMKYFLETAQCGSMSEVAEKNYLTQPAVSTAITKLETELQVQLLLRSNQGTQLTEAGRIAQRIFLQIQQLQQQLERELLPLQIPHYHTEEGCITLGTTLEISGLVDQMMQRFAPSHPNCIFAVKEYDFLDIITAVGLGRCELGLFCIIESVLQENTIQQALGGYQLAIDKLGSDQLHIGLATTSPLARKTTLPLKIVLQQPLVIYNSSLATCWHDLFLQKYTPQPKVIKTNRSGDLTDLIQNRNHLAFILSRQTPGLKDPATTPYAIIPVKEQIKVTIGLLRQTAQPISPFAQAFVNLLKQNMH